MMPTTKKYPYANTEVSVDNTRAQIDKMLQSYGIQDMQWTTMWSESQISVRFPITVTSEGVEKRVMVLLKPPLFISEHRTYDPRKGYVYVKAPNFKAGMRSLHDYIKAMLIAQKYGLAKIEDVFMSHIIAAIDDHGKEVLLGDRMRQAIKNGQVAALEEKKPVSS